MSRKGEGNKRNSYKEKKGKKKEEEEEGIDIVKIKHKREKPWQSTRERRKGLRERRKR